MHEPPVREQYIPRTIKMATMPAMMDAYWFGAREENGLVYAGDGNEPGWHDGEERTVANPEHVKMCDWGYHAADSWLHALRYAPGPIACRVRIEVVDRKEGKLVGSRKLLVAHCDASRELRFFAADCAERALLREREAGRKPDPRSWRAVEAARQYAQGGLDETALKAAAYAAGDANAANAAANAANAANAAYAAAYAAYAAANAAYAAERAWQSKRLDWWMEQAFTRKAARL